ncbi:MAG: hypothetical protein QOH49_4532 [Acidobacteriota bacterium]|jgi:hypothetical protein|nr:hypothetical protein [Acidobacteriota bacterium]
MLKHIIRSLVLLSFLGPGLSFSQQPTPAVPDAAQTAELVRKASLRRAEYREMFKDLTAEET